MNEEATDGDASTSTEPTLLRFEALKKVNITTAEIMDSQGSAGLSDVAQ
jgi:hypothetical protein